MAIIYQSTNGNAAASTGVTTNVPASIAAGDLLTAVCVQSGGGVGTISVSAGWTLIGQAVIGTFRVAWAWRIAAASGNGPTWTWALGGQCNSNCTRYTGNLGTLPTANFVISSGNGTAVAATSALSCNGAGSTILCDICVAGAQTVPTPSGYSHKYGNAANPSEDGSNLALTNVGDSSGTAPVTITSADWMQILLELQTSASVPRGTVTTTLKPPTQTLHALEAEPTHIITTLPSLSQIMEVDFRNGTEVAAITTTLFALTHSMDVAEILPTYIRQTLPAFGQTGDIEITVSSLVATIVMTLPSLQQHLHVNEITAFIPPLSGAFYAYWR